MRSGSWTLGVPKWNRIVSNVFLFFIAKWRTCCGPFSALSTPPIVRVSKLIFRILQDLQDCHAFAPSKLSSMFQTNSHSSNLFGYNFEFQLLDTSNAHVEQFAFEVARFLNTIWKHFAIFLNCHLFFELPSEFVSILIGNWSESRQNVLRMLRLIISNNFRES